MKPLKILFLTHFFFPDLGGIEVNSEILASEFHNAGHDVHLLTWTKNTGEKRFPFTVIRNPKVTDLLKQHKWADVIFENNPCMRLAWPAILLNKKRVIALRTWISRSSGKISWQDKLKFLWLRNANNVIAVSQEVRKLTWPEATVIGNPYRHHLFRIMPGVDRILPFVFLGRLVSDKGADLAIRAFHNVYSHGSKGQNLSLTIIGEGPERTNLELLAKTLGINKIVNFTGALRGDALVKTLNQHQYLLVPSKWKEPFGNVALEGLACGCLPIVADGGGLPDAVGKAGLVFQRGDVDDLTLCINNLLGDSELEETLRIAAKSHLQSHEPTAVANRYLQVIKSAINLQSVKPS
jgi:glycosyltransferase involved in cell wall biosynthesis